MLIREEGSTKLNKAISHHFFFLISGSWTSMCQKWTPSQKQNKKITKYPSFNLASTVIVKFF